MEYQIISAGSTGYGMSNEDADKQMTEQSGTRSWLHMPTDHRDSLEYKVREEIADGWEPLGNPFIRHGAQSGASFYQAMTRDTSPK